MTHRSLPAFERLDILEWQACHRLACYSRYRMILWLFRVASRVGDWPAWVLLTLAVSFSDDTQGWRTGLQFAVTAAIGALVYRLLKTRLCRERPYITFKQIPCTMPPLDRYSFPSGHTLHAVSFCTLTIALAPALIPWVAPLALLIALSRVVLGLHYLSDVAAGALLGYLLASASLWLYPVLL